MHLVVKTQDGSVESLPAKEGLSVMELLREAGQDELLALCGGCCSCATCHVFVDEAYLSLLPPISEDEDMLLDSSLHRISTSRLSCQLPFTAALDGLVLTIAPQD